MRKKTESASSAKPSSEQFLADYRAALAEAQTEREALLAESTSRESTGHDRGGKTPPLSRAYNDENWATHFRESLHPHARWALNYPGFTLDQIISLSLSARLGDIHMSGCRG